MKEGPMRRFTGFHDDDDDVGEDDDDGVCDAIISPESMCLHTSVTRARNQITRFWVPVGFLLGQRRRLVVPI